MKPLTHFHHIVLLLSDGMPHSTLEFLTGDMTTGRPPMSCYSQRIGDMREIGIEFERTEKPGCGGSDYRMLTTAIRAWQTLDNHGKISSDTKEVLRGRYHVRFNRSVVDESQT